jgi:serine/threonine protein phosphatase PrpC
MTTKAPGQKNRGSNTGKLETEIEKSPDGNQSSILESRNSDLQHEQCPSCSSPRTGTKEFCEHCGLIYASFAPPTLVAPAQRLDPSRLHGRYQLGELICTRGKVFRHRGLDFAGAGAEPLPVIILKGPLVKDPLATLASKGATSDEALQDEEVLPGFDDRLATSATETVILPFQPPWPSVAWEQFFLTKIQHSALPRILDYFTEDDCDYLVVEPQTGRPFWDAWDDPSATAEQRFGWLQQITLAMQQMHQFGVVVESLQPEMLAVSPEGTVVFQDWSGLLALPLPAEPLIRASFYTAPELVLTPDQADARADLFGFGALMYALFMGRELAEMDFARPGVPKPFLPQFPDVHPLLGRLITKTFCADRDARFPTDEAIQEDATGFKELIRVLEVCRRTLDKIRLDIGAWTSSGMVRTYNEDAFALWHGMGMQQDHQEESALVILADGMGGSAAGEVAAALAIQSLKKSLFSKPMFAGLTGTPASEPALFQVETCKELLVAALKEASAEIFAAAQGGVGKQGMGCTAELVYVAGRNLVIAHAGDSRTYHFHAGQLVQLTRDQTMVGRLVELGQLTPDEAAKHPRKSELQQALGGRPDVEPLVFDAILEPGDWVIVCSDGLSNHVSTEEMKEMLQTQAASAETAARRLVNLANLHSAMDNVTVVIIRVC